MNISPRYLFAISFFICVASVTPSPTPSHDGEMKVVCHASNMAYHRLHHDNFEADNIYPKLCTHIVQYANVRFSTALDPITDTLETYDFRIDVDDKTQKRVAGYHMNGRKVLVTLGGFTDSLGYDNGPVLTRTSSRRNFVASVVEFIKTNNFDGLELDLESLSCWLDHCESNTSNQSQHFVELVKELSEAFKPNGWLLASVVSANQTIIDAAYDVPQLAQYLDWFSLMTYDYHDSSDLQTGNQSPLFSTDNLSIDSTIKYFIAKGAPTRKLVMGITSYGQTFTLQNPEKHDLHAPVSGPGLAGLYGNMPLAFYEICDITKDIGWTVVHNPDSNVGSYAYKNDQWISYDDVDNVRAKAEYIRKMNLGGAMLKNIDMDDYKGRCGNGKYPLLAVLDKELLGDN